MLRMMLREKRTCLIFPAGEKLDERGEGQAVHPRLEAANAVAEPLGQHRDNPVGKVNAIAAEKRFTVQGPARPHIMGYIGNVHAEAPPSREALHIDRIVKIPGVIRIDGDDHLATQVLPSGGIARIDCLRHPLRLAEHRIRKSRGQIIAPDNRKHVHLVGARGSRAPR